MIPELPIRLPVGVRDFLPPAAARRRAIAEALIAEFERWGYDRIITPAFEYAAVLARALGDAASLRFVEPATGEVVALRTGQWRLYDVMWGLHIMDLQTRENTHHPILILFAALAAIGALLGCTLLFRRRKARVKA